MSELRVGLGVDAHAFGDDVPLVLGGVAIDGHRGLAGHSDGDVIAHALTDALLGAAGLGDIGGLFPSDDERYRGADSVVLLTEAYEHVRRAGFALVNADCVLVGQSPRIAPHREAMRERLAAALGVAPDAVNVRATTTDRLGFTGRGEGLAAEAVALLRRDPREGHAGRRRRATGGLHGGRRGAGRRPSRRPPGELGWRKALRRKGSAWRRLHRTEHSAHVPLNATCAGRKPAAAPAHPEHPAVWRTARTHESSRPASNALTGEKAHRRPVSLWAARRRRAV